MRRTAPDTLQRLSQALHAKPAGTLVVAFGKRFRPCKAVDWAPSVPAQLPVAVASRDLTTHETDQTANQTPCTPCKAQSALPSCRSGTAAAEYGSRHALTRASARSTASPWSSSRLQRGAGSARRVFGTQPTAGLPSARPNPSLKLTRYGRLCKPGLWHMVHHHRPGLHSLPTRAA
jgi:hypothetical protein